VVAYVSRVDHVISSSENLIRVAVGVVEIFSVTQDEVVEVALLLIVNVVDTDHKFTEIESLKLSHIFHNLSIHLIYTVLVQFHTSNTRQSIVFGHHA
jgi:hypothetical protein